ncbi:MAG: hypothetical protein ACP5RV_10005, partial [Thiomonas sp.]
GHARLLAQPQHHLPQHRPTLHTELARINLVHADILAKCRVFRGRVNSDAEVAQLANRINSMPAAGALGFQEMVIILLVAILVVLAL